MGPFEPGRYEINDLREQAAYQYPLLWDRVIQEWKSDSTQDRLWLTYSANYIARTNNVRWAIDPYTLAARLSSSPEGSQSEDLRSLDFVLLTHAHADHLDSRLISRLCHYPIRWVIPEFMMPVMVDIGLSKNLITIPKPGIEIFISGMKVLPFEARHFNTDSRGNLHGVPEMGYMVSDSKRRWLFPGDIRDYDSSWLSSFTRVDVVFAHLWLGRGAAELKQPPLLEAFCRFYTSINPKEVVITHLYELGRKQKNLWNYHHFDMVKTRMQHIDPTIKVTSAVMGDYIEL